MQGLQWRRNVALAMTATVMAAAGAGAQTTTEGAITGTVQDSTGAVIPNATVLIHNNATAADVKLTTGDSGNFNAPQLPPGTYTVTISAANFAGQKQQNVIVEVNKATEINPKLVPGESTQVVEVTAAAPVLDFEDATYGGHLSNRDIESIPINNRRWSTLALLTPGATVDLNGYGLINFRAISPLLNNVEIDGADDNQAFFSEERGRTRAGYSTSQAAVREFQVNSGVYSAEFGRAVGGVVNSVTKSGGNQIHGEAYFYNRKSSRSAFVPGATITTYNPTTGAYTATPYKPSDNRNQFGFQVGGPLIKDRLFWSYSFDMFRRNFPGTAKANNPGAFFATPSATTLNLLASRLGTTSTAAATLYNDQLQALLTDLGRVPRFGDQEINTPKLDYQINSRNHVSVLYHRLRWDSPGGVQTQGTNNYAVDSFGTDFVKLDYGLAELESLVTSKLSNELRYQYGRELNDEGQQPFSAYSKQYLTAANGNVPFVGLYTSIGFYLGSPYYSYRKAYPDERKWQIGDTATWVLGRHSVRFGEDIVHNYDLQNNLYESNGYYSYSSVVNYMSDILSGGKATCDSGGSGTGSTTSGYFPCYSSFTQSFGQPVLSLRTLDYGFFVQDDWKVSPRLTVNLGARYDYEALPAPFAPNPAVPQTTTTPSDKNNIAPRIGFAWDPYGQGKMTIHAGYGMYFGRIYNAALLNALENTGVGTTGANPTSQAAYSFSATTAGAPLLPNIATTVPPAGAIGPSLEYLDPHLQNPYTHQFDFAIQQDLGWNTILSVSYIGALGRELPNYLNLDLNPASTYTVNYTVSPASNGSCGPAACGTVIPVKVYANRLQTGKTASSYNYSPLLNPTYNGITDVISNLNSSYNGLTTEVQHRAGKVLTFDANYTWSHALDFNQTTSTSFTAGQNNWFDPYANARANYGNSLLNFPHRVVAWALLNFPGVSGKGALQYLANGWSLKPLLQSQTGNPYSVLVTGTTPNQCSVAGCLEAGSGGLSGTGVTYIPALGRDTRHYPNVALVDMRAQKEFTFAERYNLQFIGEAFNLWNHQNVTGVNTTAYSLTNSIGTTAATTTSKLVYQPAFGSVTSANSNYAFGPRQVQLAVRLVF